jgi:CRISPR-associated exonuclease Cas4
MSSTGFNTDEMDDSLPLSGLQHIAFCPRQWALIHLEQYWRENRLTAEGRLMHEAVDQIGASCRGVVRSAHGMSLHCKRLHLTGRADLVEYRPQPYPVEFKHGRSKPDDCDLVQLCAQALCLEEMHGERIERGAIFYGEPHRRLEVVFDLSLRGRVEELAERMHQLYMARTTPAAQSAPHCRSCSLRDACLPESTANLRVSARWRSMQMNSLHRDGGA